MKWQLGAFIRLAIGRLIALASGMMAPVQSIDGLVLLMVVKSECVYTVDGRAVRFQMDGRKRKQDSSVIPSAYE